MNAGDSRRVQICGLDFTPHWTRTEEGKEIPRLHFSGDVALTNAAAGALAAELSRLEWDVLAGIAPRCLPLLHVVSSFLGRERDVPLFGGSEESMVDPVELDTGSPGTWSVERSDFLLLPEKKIVLVTDVTWIPDPLQGPAVGLQGAGASVAARAAVLASQEIGESGDYVVANLLKI